ncbi:hypothetical protein [uncultured Sphingomonas sp.]|uniref:hypothetical protein n=1 Tax=uncultured Sphingomonas sp. TaxID=158754 RepID=UPI0025EF93B7|nr:hypothetical protein [uncultured Sphingomonas sp.]
MPAFLIDRRPLANMAAFKAHATFGFWNRANARGRDGEAMGQMGRIASIADLPDAAIFEAMVRDRAAAAPAKCTVKPPKPEVPEALATALAVDAAARVTFDAFPPSAPRLLRLGGRRSVPTPATRASRRRWNGCVRANAAIKKYESC